MTTETLHDLPHDYTFDSSHLVTLRHIAETDDFLPEPSHLPSSSSSNAASGSSPPAQGGYDWPVLKDAIKHRMRSCLEELGGEREMMLHPATKLVGFQEEGEDLETTWGKADAGLLCRPSTSNGVESPEVLPTQLSAMVDDDAPQTEYRYRSSHTGTDTAHPPFVHRADIQHFYPSKRSSSSHIVPALSETESTTQTRTLYTMLDEFDLQPPFTIQRLCELLISPTLHYNSPVKWVSAVKRCLSVTATRDAFPISPVQAAVGMVNGTHEERAEGVSNLELDRMDGLPPVTRSRSSSVGSGTEPLFSPIPFVVRDENGVLTQGADGRGEGLDAIPDLELGGADRTAQGGLPKEVVAATPVASQLPSEHQDTSEAGDSPATTPMPSAEVAAALEASSTPTQLPAPSPNDLGLPAGQVDEVDNPEQTVHALTSTTTTTPDRPTGSDTPEKTPDSGAQSESKENDEEQERSTKRRKSIASIHD